MFRSHSTTVDKCSQHFIGTELSTLGCFWCRGRKLTTQCFDHRARKMYIHLWFWQSRLSINKPFRFYYGTKLQICHHLYYTWPLLSVLKYFKFVQFYNEFNLMRSKGLPSVLVSELVSKIRPATLTAKLRTAF